MNRQQGIFQCLENRAKFCPRFGKFAASIAVALLVALPPTYAQFDQPIPGDLPLEEYGKYWSQYNQEVSKAQAGYSKNVNEIRNSTKPGPEQKAKLQEAQVKYRTQSQELAGNIRDSTRAVAIGPRSRSPTLSRK